MAKYILEVLITAKDKASSVIGGIGGALGGIGKAAGIAGGAVLAAGSAIGAGAFQMAQAAAPVEQVRNTFQNLSSSIGEDSGTMLTALQGATRGMVSDADLMQAANKLMSMGLAGSTEEAARLAEMATQLGSAMGTDATTSMEEFALMLANQSIPRLDTFGISSGQVRTRIEELMAADSSMTREQAFMTATMEQGAVAMQRIGEQSGTTQASMATMSAQMENLKTSIGTALLPILTSLASSLTPVIASLQPGMTDAAAAIGAVFATNIIPVLGELISSVLPVIMQLLPPITDLFSLLATTLLSALAPVIEVIIGVLIEVINIIAPVIAELLPSLIGLLEPILAIIVALLPVIVSLLGVITPIITTILPPLINLIGILLGVIERLVSWLVGRLQPAFDGIGRAIQGVMGWIQSLIDKLSSIKLPDWLTPGSPTPFELGLRGIADALEDVDANIGGLTVNATRPVMMAGTGPASGYPGRDEISSLTININTPINLADRAFIERELEPVIRSTMRKVLAGA